MAFACLRAAKQWITNHLTIHFVKGDLKAVRAKLKQLHESDGE